MPGMVQSRAGRWNARQTAIAGLKRFCCDREKTGFPEVKLSQRYAKGGPPAAHGHRLAQTGMRRALLFPLPAAPFCPHSPRPACFAASFPPACRARHRSCRFAPSPALRSASVATAPALFTAGLALPAPPLADLADWQLPAGAACPLACPFILAPLSASFSRDALLAGKNLF